MVQPSVKHWQRSLSQIFWDAGIVQRVYCETNSVALSLFWSTSGHLLLTVRLLVVDQLPRVQA